MSSEVLFDCRSAGVEADADAGLTEIGHRAPLIRKPQFASSLPIVPQGLGSSDHLAPLEYAKAEISIPSPGRSGHMRVPDRAVISHRTSHFTQYSIDVLHYLL
ncbi:MAG: hypothetical protein CMN77_13450 [Spirochaetaceae bacterium]|nr:hypothetical protein [Spirochaetaceae bacterium]